MWHGRGYAKSVQSVLEGTTSDDARSRLVDESSPSVIKHSFDTSFGHSRHRQKLVSEVGDILDIFDYVVVDLVIDFGLQSDVARADHHRCRASAEIKFARNHVLKSGKDIAIVSKVCSTPTVDDPIAGSGLLVGYIGIWRDL